ncbi:hypothetical protein HJG60_009437 [Phyllostomus discolor]|uniref:Uncharacterized protein n=1 Tax=Phyllostomus discolor TaxID=89673 RepID=A0A833YJR0_9CHIR|nr:hypothetical protein HJG60_009437 [Phyllostomus discolor]
MESFPCRIRCQPLIQTTLNYNKGDPTGQAQGLSVDSQDNFDRLGATQDTGRGVLTQSSFLRILLLYCSVKVSGISCSRNASTILNSPPHHPQEPSKPVPSMSGRPLLPCGSPPHTHGPARPLSPLPD